MLSLSHKCFFIMWWRLYTILYYNGSCSFMLGAVSSAKAFWVLFSRNAHMLPNPDVIVHPSRTHKHTLTHTHSLSLAHTLSLHVRAHTHTHTRTHTDTHAHAHAHKHAHTHTNTHTHKRTNNEHRCTKHPAHAHLLLVDDAFHS